MQQTLRGPAWLRLLFLRLAEMLYMRYYEEFRAVAVEGILAISVQYHAFCTRCQSNDVSLCIHRYPSFPSCCFGVGEKSHQ